MSNLIWRMRQLFHPKVKERPTACASCPFRNGNDAELSKVCDRLAVVSGIKKRPSTKTIRNRIRDDATQRGDFFCHSTTYDAMMRLKPEAQYRQCPGATRWFKTHGPDGRLLPTTS